MIQLQHLYSYNSYSVTTARCIWWPSTRTIWGRETPDIPTFGARRNLASQPLKPKFHQVSWLLSVETESMPKVLQSTLPAPRPKFGRSLMATWLSVCLSCWCIMHKRLSGSSCNPSPDCSPAILALHTKYEPDSSREYPSLRASNGKRVA